MNRSKSISLLLKILAILVVTGIAWTLRERAVNKLSVDYDEDDYLRAAQEYAQLIRADDWAGFRNTNYAPEHPFIINRLHSMRTKANDPDRRKANQ